MEKASQLLAEHGPNTIPPPKEWPVIARFFFSFFSGFAPLLWVAAALVFITWKPLGTPPTDVYNVNLL